MASFPRTARASIAAFVVVGGLCPATLLCRESPLAICRVDPQLCGGSATAFRPRFAITRLIHHVFGSRLVLTLSHHSPKRSTTWEAPVRARHQTKHFGASSFPVKAYNVCCLPCLQGRVSPVFQQKDHPPPPRTPRFDLAGLSVLTLAPIRSLVSRRLSPTVGTSRLAVELLSKSTAQNIERGRS